MRKVDVERRRGCRPVACGGSGWFEEVQLKVVRGLGSIHRRRHGRQPRCCLEWTADFRDESRKERICATLQVRNGNCVRRQCIGCSSSSLCLVQDLPDGGAAGRAGLFHLTSLNVASTACPTTPHHLHRRSRQFLITIFPRTPRSCSTNTDGMRERTCTVIEDALCPIITLCALRHAS